MTTGTHRSERSRASWVLLALALVVLVVIGAALFASGDPDGLERVADVTLVDQSPIGRSSRSNPVTYVKAYDDLRKVFAGTEEARRRGITPAHFSFNLETGRCPECEGTGVREVDMQFMAAVVVTCERCQGRRFRPEVLAVRHLGRDIEKDGMVETAPNCGTSEAPMRNQMKAWAEYMRA